MSRLTSSVAFLSVRPMKHHIQVDQVKILESRIHIASTECVKVL